MITLTNERTDRSTGAITRIWDVVRNGQVVAQLFKGSEPFAKWRLNNGSVREVGSANMPLFIGMQADPDGAWVHWYDIVKELRRMIEQNPQAAIAKAEGR